MTTASHPSPGQGKRPYLGDVLARRLRVADMTLQVDPVK